MAGDEEVPEEIRAKLIAIYREWPEVGPTIGNGFRTWDEAFEIIRLTVSICAKSGEVRTVALAVLAQKLGS